MVVEGGVTEVDGGDSETVKKAAVRGARPELAAIVTLQWVVEADIPVLEYGHPVTADEIDSTVREAIINNL
ncbi:hypothetical protein GCM10023318_54970 [Nocardia callitridis]|uniref:Uncharacterized protein n=1 Tax=Nocardia callitridis TaxID=648753 RepID=A0ABP9KYV9_9NOCA